MSCNRQGASKPAVAQQRPFPHHLLTLCHCALQDGAKGAKAVPMGRANPTRRAQAVIPEDSSEEEEEAAPEEAAAAVESDEENEMPVAKRPRSAGLCS